MRQALWLAAMVAQLLLGGCASTIDIKSPHDPGGGLLTSSEACLYDFDASGFWYVIFLHCDQLGMATHRHAAGHHLMLLSGDLLFYSRCSGRDEAIDIMGRTFSLRSGLIFLVTVASKQTNIVQLPARARPFDANDPAARADALAALLNHATVSSFLSEDAVSSVLKDEQAQKQKQSRRRAP